ncbi:MAG: PKD domain-containing protein [Thermoplasmata archaeon]
MKHKTASKLATALMVLLTVLSSAMVLQWNARAEENSLGTVEGIVQADDGSVIPEGYLVQLIDLHDGDIIDTSSEQGGYFQFTEVEAGYYQIHAPYQTHNKAFFKGGSDIFEVTAGSSAYEEIDVTAKTLNYIINGTVVDHNTGDLVENATVYIMDGEDYTSSTETELINNETKSYFEIRAYDGVVDLKVEAEGFAPNYTFGIDVTAQAFNNYNVTLDIELWDSPLISGYLWTDIDGEEKAVRTTTEVTLINKTTKKIMRETMEAGNPWFSIGASVGNYTLVVDAVGYSPYINETVVVGSSTQNIALGRVFVDESPTEEISTEFNFDTWDDLTLDRTRTLQVDSSITEVDYWYLGNLKMQIDMAFGNKDFDLNQTEIDAFKDRLEYMEAKIPNTEAFLTVGDVSYEMDTSTYSAGSLDDLAGSVYDTTPHEMTVTSSVDFSPVDNLTDGEDYLMDFTVKNDRNNLDYTYNITIPAEYERVRSEREVIPSGVKVSGYTEINIDPKASTTESHLTFDLRASESGEADITLEENEHVYYKGNDTYVVKLDSNVTCSVDFTDPVGSEEEANYSWLVDNSQLDKYGEEIVHKFTDEDTVELSVEIEETGGTTTSASVTVIADGTGPDGTIETNMNTVDEGQSVDFSAFNFTDEGKVRDYEWNFSDGTEPVSGANVTHVFDLHGVYEVKVNVTDIVGNWNVETKSITVEDITDPVATFNATYGEETVESPNVTTIRLERNQNIVFNAEKSYDPAGYDGMKGDVDVKWFITKVKETSTEEEVEYTFTDITSYKVHLNVTDDAGNYNNISRSIEVTPGPTPNLEVTNITLSSDKVNSGKKVTVIVNVTNYGTDIAENIDVTFEVGGKVKSVNWKLYDNKKTESNTTSIPEGEYKLVKFDWTPDKDGKKTLTANVTDGDEPSSWFYDNQMDTTVNVEPPTWRKYILYVSVPVIIIGVSLVLYFYKDKIQEKFGKE